MRICETEDIFVVGPIDILVRVWHDEANGMQAEPLRYKFLGNWHVVGVNGVGDDLIRALVANEYTESHLETIRDTDDDFAPVRYDEPPVSQSEYQEMRV